MSVLRNVDKMERILFTKGMKKSKFDISLTILSTSTKDKNKLDQVYVRSYSSNKYENVDNLKTVSVSTNEYISFNLQDFTEDGAGGEVVMCSYPHLTDLANFLSEMWDIVGGDKFFTKKHAVKPDMEEAYIQSEPLAADKILFAMPETILDENNKKHRGVRLYFNSEDKCVLLTENEVFQICTIVSEMCNVPQMLLYTNQLLILTLLGAGGGASSSDDEDGGSRPARRGLGRNVPPSRKNAFKRPTRNDDDEDEEETEVDEDEDVDFDDEDEEETPVKKKVTKKAPPSKKSSKTKSSSKSSSKKGKKTSIEDIMKEAEEMDYDEDDDDDVDFEDDDE